MRLYLLLLLLAACLAAVEARTRTDVIVAADGSRSISRYQWRYRVLPYIKWLVRNIPVSFFRLNRLGVISYSNKVDQWVRLSFRKFFLLRRINKLKKGGREPTRTDRAIRRMRRRFRRVSNRRQKIGIVITDGFSNYQSTIKQANLAKQEGVYLCAVGVGNNIKWSTMYAIASSPDCVGRLYP